MHLSLGELDFVVLEKYRVGVLNAVKRGVHRAMDCLLHCTFCGIKGYEPKIVAEHLVDMGPERVAEAAWRGAMLLQNGANADYIRCGALFWEAVLDSNAGPAALGPDSGCGQPCGIWARANGRA